MPLTEEQLDRLMIEVSVLSEPQALEVESEQALIDYLENHRDGVILSDHHLQALFLPQVWQQLPTPEVFLRHLKQKAGWPANYWSDTLTVKTFTVTSIKGRYFQLSDAF